MRARVRGESARRAFSFGNKATALGVRRFTGGSEGTTVWGNMRNLHQPSSFWCLGQFEERPSDTTKCPREDHVL